MRQYTNVNPMQLLRGFAALIPMFSLSLGEKTLSGRTKIGEKKNF